MKNPFRIKITLKDIFSNALIIFFVLIIKASVFGNFEIPTASMNPTIIEGDKIFSNNIIYGIRVPLTRFYIVHWNIPQRGDIIAFDTPPQVKSDIPFAKRVIGIPGDSIKIEGNGIILNGKSLSHKFIKESDDLIIYEENLDGVVHQIQFMKSRSSNYYKMEFLVPEGHIFVMGDNRDNSHDSRYWGFVPLDNIIGKLEFRYISKNEEAGKYKFNTVGWLK
jgi:signal peptidase I